MPSVPDRKTVARRRALVSQIKEFRQREFGLPKTRNFTRCNLKIDDCFFVYWCSKDEICESDNQISEKIFFNKKEAQDLLRQKENEGLDAYIFVAGGYVDDLIFKKGYPLTIMHFGVGRRRMASYVFHEDFHVWIKRLRLNTISSNNEVEESLADVFGELASSYFVARDLGMDPSRDKIKKVIYEARVLNRVFGILKVIYKNKTIPPLNKERFKKRILKKYKKIIFSAKAYFYKRANFASFYGAYKYAKHNKLFYDFFMCFGVVGDMNFKRALLEIKKIARKSTNSSDFIRHIREYNNRHKKIYSK